MSRKNDLDSKYINDISEILGIPKNYLSKILKLYKLYMLHDIACNSDGNKDIIINLYGIINLRLRPRSNADFGLEIKPITYEFDEERKQLSEAFFKKRDYLVEYLQRILEKDVVKKLKVGLKDIE